MRDETLAEHFPQPPALSMPKHPSASKPSKVRKEKAVLGSLKELGSTRTAVVQQYHKAPKTLKAYNGHIKRGRAFLMEVVKQKMNGERDLELGINIEELEHAFDKPPNRLSAKALELFLVQKCIVEKCSASYAEGIKAAFLDYWRRM